MIYLIIGHKGSGKTKHLIELVNSAVEHSDGNVICIEKEAKLTYDVNYRARLISALQYKIEDYDAFYGFISGILAGDHDITDFFVDATLKIGGRDYGKLAVFLKKLDALFSEAEKNITLTISADEADLPEEIFGFCQKL